MKYILYCRKSTENDDKQALSLGAQERELLELAKKKNLNIVKTYREKGSAKQLGRPLFSEMIEDIKSGKADGILCWKLDRLARNFIDGGLIIDSLQKSIIKEIVTIQKTYLPDEPVYLMSMEFGVSNQFSRDLSVNVKRGNREKLKQGGWPNLAPMGYLNDRLNRTLIFDEQRAPYIVKAFELYSTGLYSLQQVADKLFEEGFRNKGGGKVMKGKIHAILQNTFYYGMMRQYGELYPGKHETLITKDLFDKCHDVMTIGNKPRRQKHKFTFRGLGTCADCGCNITAEKQKGHSYYHCTNGKKICDQKKNFLRGNELDKQIEDKVFSNFYLDEELIDIIYEAKLESLNIDSNYLEEKSKSIQSSISDNAQKQDRLLNAFLSESIEKEIYDKKVLELKNEKKNLEYSLKKTENDDNPFVTFELVRDKLKVFAGFKKEYSKMDSDQKRESLSELLSNLSIKDREIVAVQYKKPYNIVVRPPENQSILNLCEC